jgi:hypothetical protein
VCYQINPSSGIANDLHLKYFWFLGRLLGKSMFDGHQTTAHLTQNMYNHRLAWPITLDDVEFVEPHIYNSHTEIRKVEDGDTTSQATHHHARYCLSPMGTWDFAHRLQPSCIGVGGAAERVNISKRNLVSGTCYYTKTETHSGPHWTLYQTPCAIETIGTKHQTPRTSVQRGVGVCEPGSRCLSSE